MGRKCGVESCLSDSGRKEDTGVTFHKVPLHPDIRPKWLSLCRIPEDKRGAKVIYICSRHFLRADFCNFKGKKYMLRQGVLPSVFPWSPRPKIDCDNKHQKARAKADAKTEPGTQEETAEAGAPVALKSEPPDHDEPVEVKQEAVEFENIEIKQEICDKEGLLGNQSQSATIEQKNKTVMTAYGPVNFALNEKIEALDFNEMWYPARIVEIDYQENEVLIHFEKYSNKYDEWICMESSRLRPLQQKKPVTEKYTVGERCMASWSDSRKFPATVARVINEDTYEVVFDDGFTKILKGHRMVKAHGQIMQSSPLFDPVRGTKQERRDKKRKINSIAELFGKKPRPDGCGEGKNSPQASSNAPESSPTHTPSNSSSNNNVTTVVAASDEAPDSWMPVWNQGRPVGTDSTIETNDGTKKSVIVADPRLPPGWIKHLTQRTHGASAGKWDTIIVNPEGRRFRTRAEIRAYLEGSTTIQYCDLKFDFSLHRPRRDKIAVESRRSSNPSIDFLKSPARDESPAAIKNEEEGPATPDTSHNSLKIPWDGDGYKCPIEGCGKTFRKENIAQMHVKHYHPKYTKFLDSTPNVADLAYARTVGESLDRSPSPVKATSVRQVQKTPTALAKQPSMTSQKAPPEEQSQHQPLMSAAAAAMKAKDAEIIKLLSSKPFDGTKKDDDPQASVLPPGLPANMYPDIKLKDLLNKSEGIPKGDEINIRTLSSSTARPTGIKTLLPVVRTGEQKVEDGIKEETVVKSHSSGRSGGHRSGVKRKRASATEIAHEALKKEEEEPLAVKHETLPPQPEHQNIIIEGGEVIKIVQMKREEIINCTCGITEEDGLMIQCELCLCWQHAYCNNIQRESQVPEKYVCYICQNPVRQRLSKRYFHDQDWLKFGVLPTASYHAKDQELLGRRFETLKKSHDITGGLIELKQYLHTLDIKLKIAEAKNHPKLYLWSKPWEKLPLPEKIEANNDDEDDGVNKEASEIKEEEGVKGCPMKSVKKEAVRIDGDDDDDGDKLKGDEIEPHDASAIDDDDIKQLESDSVLFSILKSGKEQQQQKKLGDFPKLDINSLIDENVETLDAPDDKTANDGAGKSAPIIPQPEAAIDSGDCRINLLEHIAHSQNLVEERLDDFEKQLDALEAGFPVDGSLSGQIRSSQTLQMLIRDAAVLQEFSHSSGL